MGSAVAAAALLAAVVLRTAGMTFIAYAFAADFLASPFAGGTTRVIIYALFALLSVAGPVLHAISLVPSFRSRRASPS